MSEPQSPRLGARTLLIGAAVVVVLAGLKAAQSLIIPFLLALFLAIICTPAVSCRARCAVPRHDVAFVLHIRSRPYTCRVLSPARLKA